MEVLIVLAISGLIFTSSVGLFSGQKAKTEFSQAMYDLQSKFQSYVNSVSSASLPSGDAYICGVSSVMSDGKVYPILTVSSGDQTTNQDCIYLGRAIQIIPGSDTLYSYPVLGLRTIHNGSVDSGYFPTTPLEANPEPALDGSSNFLLVEPYQLLNGLSVVSARATGGPEQQNLLTFYSDLRSSNTSGNQITASALTSTFGLTDVKSARLRSCIEKGSCGGSGSADYSLTNRSWKLCVQKSDGSKKAELSIQGSVGGITTKLNLEGCSVWTS